MTIRRLRSFSATSVHPKRAQPHEFACEGRSQQPSAELQGRCHNYEWSSEWPLAGAVTLPFRHSLDRRCSGWNPPIAAELRFCNIAQKGSIEISFHQDFSVLTIWSCITWYLWYITLWVTHTSCMIYFSLDLMLTLSVHECSWACNWCWEIILWDCIDRYRSLRQYSYPEGQQQFAVALLAGDKAVQIVRRFFVEDFASPSWSPLVPVKDKWFQINNHDKRIIRN